MMPRCLFFLGVMGAFLLTMPSVGLGQNLLLTPDLTLSVGKNPDSLAVGDFNNDGFSDVATVNSASDDVAILAGNGNGSFRSAIAFGVGKSPMSVAAGDLEDDGNLDLVVAATGSDEILVLSGQGNGLFRSPVRYKTGKGPTFVAVRDLDRDKALDVVVVNSGRFGHYGPFSVSVFFNEGNGQLGQPVSYGAENRNGMFPTGVAIEDINADGWPDLAVSWSQPSYRTPSGLITILTNTGMQRFLLTKEIPAGLTLSAVLAKDLDADGDQDLIATSLFSDEVIVALQDASEYFSVQEPYGVGFSPIALTTEDLNKDGMLDIITTNRASNSVSVILGDGNGAFHPAGHFRVGRTPTSVMAHDFDLDGRPDIVTTNSVSDDVTVLLSGAEGLPSRILSTENLMFQSNGHTVRHSVQSIRISNIGLGALKIHKISLTGRAPESFFFSDEQCRQQVLPSGTGCIVNVRFIATLPGNHHAELTIWDNAPGGPRSIQLSGTREN